MTHHASPRFWRCYRGLPKEVQELADRNCQLLKIDPTGLKDYKTRSAEVLAHLNH